MRVFILLLYERLLRNFAEREMKFVRNSAKQNFTAKQFHAAQRYFTRPQGRISLKKAHCKCNALFSGGGRWIRTTEGIASRFTVCPLWPLGNSPILTSLLKEVGAGRRTRTPDLLITKIEKPVRTLISQRFRTGLLVNSKESAGHRSTASARFPTRVGQSVGQNSVQVHRWRSRFKQVLPTGPPTRKGKCIYKNGAQRLQLMICI